MNKKIKFVGTRYEKRNTQLHGCINDIVRIISNQKLI
jgi:hypothetical protein